MIDINSTLIQLADNTLLNIGMPVLEHPIFCHCPIGLRFEISEPWGDNEHFAYFENAYQKVFQIYNDFPSGFDTLRIDVQGGGNSQFSSSVFLFDTSQNILFHLYDDRGLDLVAKEKSTVL